MTNSFFFSCYAGFTYTHEYTVRAHSPARCWQVPGEARRSICHLQHLPEKSSGNTEALLTKITSLNTESVQQRGHWELKLAEGIKKYPERQNSLFPRRAKWARMWKCNAPVSIWKCTSSAHVPLRLSPITPLRTATPLSSSSVALVRLWRPFLLLAQSTGQNGKPAAYY